MVTAISRFRVRNGLEKEVLTALLNRPRLVESVPGFCGMDVLTDAADPALFLILTRWTDEQSFRVWHRSEAHHRSHGQIPQGLKLDASFTSLTVANSIESPDGVHFLNDAIEGQTVALSRWLMESDAIVVLLLAPDGTIRLRNRAGNRIFPPDPAKGLWDYLAGSESENLRQRFLDSGRDNHDHFLLNVASEPQSTISLEGELVPCSRAFLLLATQESRFDLRMQSELQELANNLSIMMREGAQKNRELRVTNETVERLARTDALTGLANRRTLFEGLQREIARAERSAECLSVIIADLDHFKSINDQYGHVTGDLVLARTAAVFGSQLRPYDLAARYGGEEFVLLLPGISTEAASTVAERIRKDVAEIKIPECPRQITVSFGVASWMAGETPEGVVARADAALYNAKRTGRNRVEAASDARDNAETKGFTE